MIRLGLQVFDSGAKGMMLADWTAVVRNAEWGSGEHGFSTLSAFVPMGMEEAFRWFNRPELPFVTVGWGGRAVWEGRIEDVALKNGGIGVRAFGRWRAFSDLRYTALWGSTGVGEWRPSTVVANRDMQRFEYDTNNRLYIAPRKGEVFSLNNVGGLYFLAPDGQVNDVREVSASYEFMGDVNWLGRVFVYDEVWGGGLVALSLVGSGVLQTGTFTYVVGAGGYQVVEMVFYRGGAVPVAYVGETGDYYFKLTSVRVQGVSGSFTAQAVVQGVVGWVSGVNGGQISGSGALIGDPGLTLTDEVYEDKRPAEVLNNLALRGDGSESWEVGVAVDGLVFFRPRGSAGVEWFVDVLSIELERSLDTMFNRVYAAYRDGNGRVLRSGVADDVDSIDRYGVIRSEVVDVDTTSLSLAESYRDGALAESGVIVPRSRIVLRGVYGSSGGRYPLWMVGAGDVLVIRNLSPSLGSDLDKLRRLRIRQCLYNGERDVLTVATELDLPSLELLVVR